MLVMMLAPENQTKTHPPHQDLQLYALRRGGFMLVMTLAPENQTKTHPPH